MGTQYGPHRKSWDIPGSAHCLTFSCFHRQSFFRGERPAGWFLAAVVAGRRKAPFDLWAYVIMPEHVHIVILPQDGVRIADILWRLKRPVTGRAVSWVRANAPEFLPRMADAQPGGKVTYRFWQRGGGHDRNLRSVADVHEKIEYVHANPVRRGLVTRPEDWAWSSARAWATGVDEPIAIDRDSLPPLEVLG